MNMLKVNTYILCGGKSSRMKREKGLVDYRGKSFISRILHAIKPVSERINLVTANPEYGKFGYGLVKDIYPGRGPIGGIHTALEHSWSAKNLILSCDIPLISTQLIEKLVLQSALSYAEIHYLADADNDFPLIGVYEKHLAIALEKNLEQDQLRLQHFVQSRDSRKIKVGAEEANFLKNINTPQELASLN